MQLEEIQIPVYFGGFIDVFWDSDGIIRVDTERDRLSICANGPALAALAKQLLYFSCNNSLRHAHVHTQTEAIYGPFAEKEDFERACKEQNVGDLGEWIPTVPAPEGAEF